MSANTFPIIKTNITTTPQYAPTSPQKQPANPCKPEKWIPLIINELSAKTHENTGNKPVKPEMNNKYNMIRCYHNTPADRYKKAQPLMVPFDAEEQSSDAKLINPKF